VTSTPTDQQQLFHPYPIRVTPLDADGNPIVATKAIWVKELETGEMTNMNDVVWHFDKAAGTILNISWTFTQVSEDVMRLLCGLIPLNRKIWKQIGKRRLARQRR